MLLKDILFLSFIYISLNSINIIIRCKTMKKIIIGLSMLLALGFQAMANDELSKSMRDMRNGLQLIQDGFSYNNKEGILAGIQKIQDANKIFHDEKSSALYLPKNKQRFAKVSFLSAYNMNLTLEQMKEYVELGEIVEASDSMSGIIHSCTRCHAIVRRW